MHVVKIGATWCNACLVMRPRWAEIEKELPWLKSYYLDYDDNEKEISDLGLDPNKLPIFLFYDDKNTVKHPFYCTLFLNSWCGTLQAAF